MVETKDQDQDECGLGQFPNNKFGRIIGTKLFNSSGLDKSIMWWNW